MDRNAMFQELYNLVKNAYPQQSNQSNQKRTKEIWDKFKAKSNFFEDFQAAKEELRCRKSRSKATMSGFFLKASKQRKKLAEQVEDSNESSRAFEENQEPSSSSAATETSSDDVKLLTPQSKYLE